jgi:large subunit ribosomal protein L21
LYAVIKSGGRQYKVTVDQAIRVDRLDAEAGSQIVLDQVLLLADGETVTVGQPLIPGARALATVLGHDRAKKIRVFKKKRRKGYQKTQGHRQDYTALKITGIGLAEAASSGESHGS